MPSEWAEAKAAHLTAILDAQSVHGQSARILAEALDAARLDGLEEAAKIAEMVRDNLYDAEVNREFMSAAAIGAETCKKKISARIEEVKRNGE